MAGSDSGERRPRPALLALGALGVVYGDIGTSPLYAFRECFEGAGRVDATAANALGVASLIFWALTLIVTLKYLVVVLRADNRGEGGILALVALCQNRGAAPAALLSFLAMAGAALLFADGLITPAVSVLAAIEGLSVVTPAFEPFVVPIAAGILIGLFALQRRGTGRIAYLFGPLAALWFLSIAVAGAVWVVKAPAALAAVDPAYAVHTLIHGGPTPFFVLGSVVLSVTGAEALYADLGHFGRRAIRTAWFALVYPALLLSYFGQAASVIARGGRVEQPFYALVPAPLLVPMVALATIATIIASQALISGMFSVARQAILFDYLPRLKIVFTSRQTEGQIYLPAVNLVLAIGCVALVLFFRSSSGLASAYGLAVMGTMVITSVLLLLYGGAVWGKKRSWLVLGGFLAVDVAFFGATIPKAIEGAWMPIAVALAVFSMLSIWRQVQDEVQRQLKARGMSQKDLLRQLESGRIARVPGSGVFLAKVPGGVPVVLRHHLDRNKVLHEQVLLVTIVTHNRPTVPPRERVRVEALGAGVVRVTAGYGFAETPTLPDILDFCATEGVAVDPEDLTFYVGRLIAQSEGRLGFSRLQVALYSRLARNARTPVEFYGVPAHAVVEIGLIIEL